MSLKGKTVIVTGASSGIGEACAFAFGELQANIVLAARNIEKLKAIEACLSQKGIQVLSVQCDVSIEADCIQLIEQSISKFGRVDVLINNAGISMRALFKDMDLKVMEALMQTNFWGAVYCTKHALPHLIQSKGSVVAVNSWAGFTGLPARTAYSASKFALLGFMESLRVENLKTGLHVGSIFPGYTESNIRRAALDKDGNAQAESPLNEASLMKAEEVANYIVQMVVKRKKYQVITLTGKLMYWINKIFPNYIDQQVYKVIAAEKNSPFQ